MMTQATIRVPGLELAVPLAAEAPPRDPVPTDGPAGEPTLGLVLDGSPPTARAELNGKDYRKLLEQVAEQGAGAERRGRPAGGPEAAGGPGRAVRAGGGRLPGQRQGAPPGRAEPPQG